MWQTHLKRQCGEYEIIRFSTCVIHPYQGVRAPGHQSHPGVKNFFLLTVFDQ